MFCDTEVLLGSVLGPGFYAERFVRVVVVTAISPFAILSQEILRLAQAAIEKALDDSIQMRDWALEALGMQTESLAALGLRMALPQSLPRSAFKPEKCILMHCSNS